MPTSIFLPELVARVVDVEVELLVDVGGCVVVERDVTAVCDIVA
jgi:hypothetical protein